MRGELPIFLSPPVFLRARCACRCASPLTPEKRLSTSDPLWGISRCRFSGKPGGNVSALLLRLPGLGGRIDRRLR
ncbi:hypothetical protein CesoFtcFv8_001510 [Champsocephalus esox]|uniref:Uncharacterized protein n=1 Tax=Champsocephalus esox TaxID=159716 RepID=A0AAN8D3L1_9TELE|nr:hypothetical protein CesoFtcFv8_001510 [Champsocephalus esox]